MQKRNLILQAAIAGAFGVAGMSAHAATLGQYSGGAATPSTYAKETIGTGNVTFNKADTLWTAAGTENYVGRSTAFAVRFTLPAGTTFSTTVAAGSATTVTGLTNLSTVTAGHTFFASLISGGTSGSSQAVVSLSPKTTGSTYTTTGINLVDGTTTGITLIGSSLLTGSSQTATAQVYDPVGGATFETDTGVFGQMANALSLTVTAETSGVQIDVATNSDLFTSSATGLMGAATNVVNVGQVKFALKTTDKTSAGTNIATSDITNVSFTLGAANGFVYTPFAPLTSSTGGEIFLDAGTGCTITATGGYDFTAVGTGGTAAGVVANAAAVNAAGTTVTFNAIPYGAAAIGVMTSGHIVDSTNYNVCLQVPAKNTTAIATGTPTANFVSATVIGTWGGATTTESGSGNLYTLSKNGWSTSLNFLVPVEESSTSTSILPGYYTFVRISNNSSVSGAVYATLTDDSAVKATCTLTTSLAAGASTLYSTAALETACGVSKPTGQLRLDLSGVFPTGQATDFMIQGNGNIGDFSSFVTK